VAAVGVTAAPVVALLFCCVLPPFHQTEPAAPLVSNWSPGRPVHRQVQAVTHRLARKRGGEEEGWDALAISSRRRGRGYIMNIN
jgi:hypothetical protein